MYQAGEKVIITCALTGGIHGKEANPNLPEQPDEIVAQGIAAWRAGAAILHVHARKPDGSNTMDPAIYGELHQRLCAAPGRLVLPLLRIAVAVEDDALVLLQEPREELADRLLELLAALHRLLELARDVVETILKCFAPQLRTLEMSVLNSLLAHPLLEAQELGGQLLLNHNTPANELPSATIESLIDSPYESMRGIGIKLFGQLDDDTLYEYGRDLALVVSDDVPAGEVLAAIRSTAGALAEHVELFDRFVGDARGSIPKDHASLAVRVVYRAADRTLTDAEVDERHAQVVSEMQRRFSAHLRTS